ncbi:MAG: hypothetical protein AB7G44_17495 [Bacteroidia bacterium]
MSIQKLKTLPVLEFKRTTALEKIQFPRAGYVKNADKYRLHLNGVPERIAYTYRKRQELYYSVNVHQAELYTAIKQLPCTAFPDNSKISIYFERPVSGNRIITCMWLMRKQTVFSVCFTISIDHTDKAEIWHEDTYMKMLKAKLKQAGCKFPYYVLDGDTGSGAILEAEFFYSTTGTLEQKVYESIVVLENLVDEVENALLPLVK